jgi:hypothetical protein
VLNCQGKAEYGQNKQRRPLPAGCKKAPPFVAEGGGANLNYFMPSIFPTLRWRPAFDIGMPVAFAIFCFAFVMSSARFQLKDKPGILRDFFAMSSSPPF